MTEEEMKLYARFLKFKMKDATGKDLTRLEDDYKLTTRLLKEAENAKREAIPGRQSGDSNAGDQVSGR